MSRMAQKGVREGERLGRFLLVKKIGEGASSRVYEALDMEQGIEVALKAFSSMSGKNSAEARLFRKEFSGLASLRHPHIVPVYEFFEEPIVFYTMELVRGGSLGSLIHEGAVSRPLLIRILLDVCEGLSYIHGKGIVHRDLKPSNILLCSTRAPGRRKSRSREGPPLAKVADFGFASPIETAAAPGRGVAGTLAYMAPEQLRGPRIDGRADLYSLGAVIFECLTGRTPFTPPAGGDGFAPITERTVPHPLDCQPGSDPELARLAVCLLREDPEERFQSAEELATELSSCLSRTGGTIDPVRRETDPTQPDAALFPPVFCGRKEEMARLDESLVRAVGGEGSIIWIRGEMGIGKTTLLRRFAARHGHEGVALYPSRGRSSGSEPFSVFIPPLAAMLAEKGSLVSRSISGGMERMLSLVAPHAW